MKALLLLLIVVSSAVALPGKYFVWFWCYAPGSVKTQFESCLQNLPVMVFGVMQNCSQELRPNLTEAQFQQEICANVSLQHETRTCIGVNALTQLKNEFSEADYFKTEKFEECVMDIAMGMSSTNVCNQGLQPLGTQSVMNQIPQLSQNNPTLPSGSERFLPGFANSFQNPLTTTNRFQNPFISSNGFRNPLPNTNRFQNPFTSSNGLQNPFTNSNGFRNPLPNTNRFQNPFTSGNGLQNPFTNSNGFRNPLPNTNRFQNPLPVVTVFKTLSPTVMVSNIL
ncbi:uncharacterized protein LOC143251086 [Tachypleus tridentatus]|uniref:uncharacterized protein LOC143251086 n=1 Tax=Tachypleus tridentatus TaxID=6853 RepID=UPI003FD0FD70